MSTVRSSKRSEERLAELALFGSGMAYGASTPIGRELGVWLNTATIVAIRFAFALPFCLLNISQTKRQVDTRLIRLTPVAVLFPLSAAFFTLSFTDASIAVAIFSYYIANLLSSLIVGVALHHEAIDRATRLAFVFSVAATICIALGQGGTSGAHPLLGFIFGAGSGLLNTAIAQEQKHVAKYFDGEVITLAQVLGGVVLATLAALVLRDTSVTNMGGTAVGLGALYGLLFFACNRLMVYGFRAGPIGLGSVLLSIEVVVGPILAFAFFHEGLTTLQVLGGVFTGCAVVSTARRRT